MTSPQTERAPWSKDHDQKHCAHRLLHRDREGNRAQFIAYCNEKQAMGQTDKAPGTESPVRYARLAAVKSLVHPDPFTRRAESASAGRVRVLAAREWAPAAARVWAPAVARVWAPAADQQAVRSAAPPAWVPVLARASVPLWVPGSDARPACWWQPAPRVAAGSVAGGRARPAPLWP